MKNNLLLTFLFFICSFSLIAQQTPKALHTKNTLRCATQVSIEEAIKKNPSITEKWRKEGERQYQAYLQRKILQRGPTDIKEAEIIIPIVFHLVDEAANLSVISDRDIYDQVELLNEAYNGKKADQYKNVIPGEIYNRLGRIPIKFVLAKRTPAGKATSGIERRTNTTPDRISVKSTNTGGLDAWDTNLYVNVWAGSFSGDDQGLLGIATPPFYTSEGPQGIVMGLFALPYASNITRNYYPAYSEGVTLIHEIGHYFYLWHTFGDETYCNNLDFRIQPGWPLPVGAGPEGDDTPQEKEDSAGSAHYGNPSENYSDGCEKASYGMMYGSFMNYFDDRAMFMFSEGMRKRVIGCLDLYRPGLKTSNGAIAPSPTIDAYLVTMSPRGNLERRAYIVNNTPLKVVVRNNGNSPLTAVTVNVKMDAGIAVSYPFNLNLSPGKDTALAAGILAGTTGTHTVGIYVSKPNNMADAFMSNDTIESFIFINQAGINAPFTEDFTGTAFPPENWQVWNANTTGKTWEKSANSGFTTAGSATVQNFTYKGGGQLDDLITPPINMGIADSSLLTFGVAYRVFSNTDVSVWDGLEVYLSNDGGINYQLIYKKTGNQLKTVASPLTSSFSAPLGNLGNWRKETINLTPYLVRGQKFLVKFRQVNAYGNNLYLDDIAVSAFVSVDRDVKPTLISGIPLYVCEDKITPGLTFKSDGSNNLTSLKINYSIDNGNVASVNWTGSLSQGKEASLTLPSLPAQAPGAHTLTIFTSQPNGLNDLNVINDTLRQTFYSIGREVSPVSLDFENVNFPPSQWVVANFENDITWERTTAAAAGGLGSMRLPNFKIAVSGTRDQFISPIISGNELYDSVFVAFDYAYDTGTVQATNLDTLEIAVSLDCGKSFISVWKQWGGQLKSQEGASTGLAYIPKEEDWKNIKIPLFPLTGNNNFQVFFTFKGNRQNNIYVDNINIYGVAVPPRLKKQGYLIYPNPFTDQFIIRNYEEPVGFKSAALFNTAGQRVWMQIFDGKAQKEVYVNGSRLAKGVYTLKLFYADKTVIEKIVKL